MFAFLILLLDHDLSLVPTFMLFYLGFPSFLQIYIFYFIFPLDFFDKKLSS